MKRTFRRVTAALLAALVLFGCMPEAAVAAVQMPQGYTAQQAEASIPKAEKLLGAVLRQNEKTADLSGTVYGALFSDATVNAIFSGIYSGFSENQSTFESLGIDISVPRVAAVLQGYPGVYAVLNGHAAWAEVLPLVNTMRWNIGSKDGFASALAAMLSPLNAMLFTLLCSGTYNINALIRITGADGYQNAVVPLLEAVGCPNIMSQADYTAAAAEDRAAMAKNLCNMLFAALDNILKTPVASLCTYLPSIAYYLQNGGLSDTLKTLMEPLQVKIAVFSLSGVNKLLENSEMFSSESDLTAMLQKADLGSLMGADVDFKLPEIDLDALAACGSVSDGKFTSNRAEAFILILRWAVEAVKQNASALAGAGMDTASLSDILNKKGTDGVVKLLLDLLNLNAAPSVLTYTWSYPEYTPGTASFTPNLTRENYEKVLAGIDSTLNDFLLEFTDKGSLSSLVRTAVYSNKTVTGLVKALYGALDTKETESLGSLLGLAVTPAAVAGSIRGKFPSAARSISAVSSWDKLNENVVSWGFANGDETGFTNTIIALLRPFAKYLRFLLAEGSITLFDTVTLSGGNGYETAVIPLLEGVGCDPDTVVSYAAYKSGGDEALISNILKPVTALLDGVCETPVASLCGLLPNLVYFMESGTIKQCVTNLMYPVQTLTGKLGVSDLLPADLTASMDLDIDLAATLKQLTAGTDLGVELPQPDLALIKSLGTAETRQSKRTAGGAPQQYTYIAADKPLVLVTVLRYVLGAVKNSGDPSALTGLMGGMGGMGGASESDLDMMAVYTEKIGAQLAEMSVDDTIEWLYNLLFSETPKREKETGEEIIPTVIYNKQKDYTALKRVLLAVFGLALILGTVIFAARFDFHAHAQRRKRKKQKKEQAKQAAQMQRRQIQQRQPSQPQPSQRPLPQPQRQMQPWQMQTPQQQPHQPQQRQTGAPAPVPVMLSPQEEASLPKAQRKALKNLRQRQEKAARRAYRASIKADKYYAKAAKDARNR